MMTESFSSGHRPVGAFNQKDLGMSEARREELKIIARLAMGLRPEDMTPELYVSRGNAWFHGGELENAIKDYKEALRIRPDYDVALNNWCTALVEQSKQ